ncbi:MAG TPA: molecular chaperone TorD family protein [Streptosporangiaceae bacterium]|nr:molecular chaperone TorD family protein [Streptosporangiaceae bacterium]
MHPGPNTSDVAAERELLLVTARLLAKEIDADLYRALLRADAGTSDETAAGGEPLVDEEIRSLDEPRALEELSVEFCRLFVGPRPVCPPYESVYRGEAMVGGRAERRVQEFLRRHGMEAVLAAGLPVLSSDHLAVELAVLAHLYPAAEDARGPDPRAARSFMASHVSTWAPAYLGGLRDAARLAPYRTIAGLAARLLTHLDRRPVSAHAAKEENRPVP